MTATTSAGQSLGGRQCLQSSKQHERIDKPAVIQKPLRQIYVVHMLNFGEVSLTLKQLDSSIDKGTKFRDAVDAVVVVCGCMGKVALQSPTHGQEFPLVSHSLLDKQVVGPKALSHAADALPHLRYELFLLGWIEHPAQQSICMSSC